MTHAELAKRRLRVTEEALILKRVDGGFRVYPPGNPTKNYLVTDDPRNPTCTCPDFMNHDGDTEWRCKHILAVESHLRGGSESEDPVETEERRAIQEESRRSEVGRRATIGACQMLLKRSVSPDGRIDSLSVEFTCPSDGMLGDELKGRARRVLELQSEIVDEFLGRGDNGNGHASQHGNGASKAVSAKMLRIGGIDTRWGRRLFINVQVNGDTLKLFGSKQQLAEAIEAAGFPNRAERIDEGVKLDLPCRVTTKPSDDGRYVNVDEVFPSPDSRPNGRPHP
jgi:predicted nucleic acid-binding Zn finger protein